MYSILPTNEFISYVYLVIEIEIILLFSLVLLVLARKIVINIKNKLASREIEKFQKLLECMLHDDFSKLNLNQVPKTIFFRKYLADVARNFQVDSKFKITNLYCHLKFDLEDFKALDSKNPFKRMRALDSIEKLNLVIPHTLHLALLHDSNYVIRVLAMQYYMSLYKNKSLFQFILFIEAKKYKKRGIQYNLIEQYGDIDPSGVSFLFERTNDKDMEIALMFAAARSPREGIADIIYKKIKINAGKKHIVGALKVLSNFPDDRFYKLLNILKNDTRWVIRLHTIRQLKYFSNNQTIELLKQFTVDTSYLVRTESIGILVDMIGSQNTHQESQNLLNQILLDTAHPAHLILVSKMQMDILQDQKAA